MLAGAGTGTILSNRRVIDMSDTIYLLEPNAAPLYVLVSKLKKKSVFNPQHEWLEDDLNPRETTVATSHSVGATNTSLVIGDSAYVNAYDILYNTDSEEKVLVTAGTTGASLTVSRGYSNTTAASMTAANTLLIMGSAFEEGEAESNVLVKSTQVTRAFNYTQIFRKKVEVTGTLAASRLYGGPDRNYQRKKKGIELMRDFETAYWWGSRGSSSGTTHNVRSMRGANDWITTNSDTSVGTLTETEFETHLRNPFRYGATQKYMFASPLAVSVVSQWAQGKLQMVPKDKTYGIAITQYLSPHGTLNIVKENLFETDKSGVVFIVELGEMQYVYLQGRDVKLQTNIGTIGDDVFKDQYICEIGCEFRLEKKHSKMTGVTG
jgi:hypothetical protein